MPRMFCRRELSKNIYFSVIFSCISVLHRCLHFPFEFIALCILKSCACVLAINKLIAICAPLAPAWWHFRSDSRGVGGRAGEVLAGATFPTREPATSGPPSQGHGEPILMGLCSSEESASIMALTFRIEFHKFAVVVVEAASEHGSRLRHAQLIAGSVQFRGTHNQGATAIENKTQSLFKVSEN